MYSEDLFSKVKEAYLIKKCYLQVSKDFGLSYTTVRYMCTNDYSRAKEKPGCKSKLCRKDILLIKKESRSLLEFGEKVTSRKIKNNLSLEVSRRTIQRLL